VNIFYFLTDLPIIQTDGYRLEYEYEFGDEPEVYGQMHLFHAQNSVRLPTQKLQWEVTVSVTTEYDAYIALCEGEDPAESACYCINFGRWQYSLGYWCKIKRCPHGAEEPCETTVAENDVSVIFQVH
jgi:hypothetical protein